ncbi:E6 protein [Eumops bonariensis papillomavirus type 2]|nr:E6 protein [Eumops bonariensis papillomavirus type 2]
MAVRLYIKMRSVIFGVKDMDSGSDDEVTEVGEAFEPKSIQTLCQHRGISPELFVLPCWSCLKILSYYEKFLFEYQDLRLFYKEGAAFGICQSCVRHRSQCEFLTSFQKTFSAYEFEEETGCSVFDVPVRCLVCPKHLTLEEKKACIDNFEGFQQVGPGLRAQCSMCRVF